jgi:hypothetical protein
MNAGVRDSAIISEGRRNAGINITGVISESGGMNADIKIKNERQHQDQRDPHWQVIAGRHSSHSSSGMNSALSGYAGASYRTRSRLYCSRRLHRMPNLTPANGNRSYAAGLPAVEMMNERS